MRCPCFFALKKLIGVMTKIQQFLRCLTWNCVIRYVQMLSFRQQNNYVVSRYRSPVTAVKYETSETTYVTDLSNYPGIVV